MFMPHAPWWRALQHLDSGMTFDYFVGISSAPAELSACAPGCDCRMRFAMERSVRSGVEACGYRIRDEIVPTVSRSPEKRGLRSHRELRALLEWTAASLRPPTWGGCV